MQFLPYLNFDGTCAEAMKTYHRIFGGELSPLMTFGSTPGCEQLPPEARDRIMHVSLDCDGGILMASDTFPDQCADSLGSPAVAISFPEVARAREVADQLAEGGQVQMPLAETFWVEAFASVKDRFGIVWLINGGKPKMGPGSDAA